MDHDPDWLMVRQLPLTAVFRAASKRSASRALPLRLTPPLHLPEYSPLLPETDARQDPVHPAADFAADHAPRLNVWPFASTSVHVPVTVPLVASATAVHVPTSVSPVLFLALHEPFAAP